MTSFVSHTSVDCADAYALSEWWKQVLGYIDLPDDPNSPGDPECMIVEPMPSRKSPTRSPSPGVSPASEQSTGGFSGSTADHGHRVLFIEVPEPKTVKNRMHFDLRPGTGSRDDEVERVLALGATLVADHRGITGPGTGWVVLADPEGNEFCILRSPAELATN
ncbi:MAG: VOC family protein [Micropruina sp.]|uniref:VOC family protein n=1 Tax=Micropruina sp. TaxID=2737536 RepID=UPI0039E4EA18